jgi:hypothetical protein
VHTEGTRRTPAGAPSRPLLETSWKHPVQPGERPRLRTCMAAKRSSSRSRQRRSSSSTKGTFAREARSVLGSHWKRDHGRDGKEGSPVRVRKRPSQSQYVGAQADLVHRRTFGLHAHREPQSGESVSVESPETQYAWNGRIALAYQVVGDGPVDLLYLQGRYSNVDMNWESPYLAALLHALARNARLIITDRRGFGGSSR